jgi:hypothetical protein
MIIYQLPNGKIVHLSVDQFREVYNPFSIKESKPDDYDPSDIDSIDYEGDDDEPSEPFDINNLFEE